MATASTERPRVDPFSNVAQVAKAIRDQLRDDFEERLGEVEDGVVNVGKLLREELDRRIAPLQRQVDEVLSSYREGMERLERVLQGLPVPQVNVSAPNVSVSPTLSLAEKLEAPLITVNVPQQQPPSIHVAPAEVHLSPTLSLAEMLPPAQVTVNVPQQAAPNVHVAAPNVTVNPSLAVPRQEAPNVTVNVPKMDIPPINVNLPKRKTKTEKSIVYSESTGRATKVIEETTEE